MFRSHRPFCKRSCVQALFQVLREPTSGTRSQAIRGASLSFSEGGNLPVSLLTSFSGDFEDVFFGSSDIALVNASCRIADNCFDAAFGLSGIFQTTGTYFASDGGAKIVISQVAAGAPIPELPSWAWLGVGFAGLAFARNRRIWRPRLRQSDSSAI
jgi:hypothetical protein